MWLWGTVDIDRPDAVLEWGIDIESYVDEVAKENSTTYFHNLKFDGHFLIDWMLKHGYTYVDEGDRGLVRGTFSALISDQNKVYSITVRWWNGKNTEFRDSYKKLPMSVSNVARSFDLPMTKGDLDYHAKRPVGYQPDEDELDYLERDIRIIALALKEVLDNGMTRLTVASDSLAEYKRIVGEKWFKRTFPVLADEMDSEIRRAYRGGFTYADPRFMSCKQGSGIVLDVNSLYPAVMYNDILPHGEPEFVEGRVEPTESRPLTVFSITFVAKLKPGHIPCIQIKGSFIFGSTEYLTEINEPTTLMVTNVDLDLYNEHYDMHILAYGGGWRFKGVRGLFDDYIDKWSKVKVESTGGKREIAKLHLNALYGKFGSNPNITGRYPIIEDGRVRFIRGEDKTKAPIYTAIAVFVTAYARALTIRAAQTNYDHFAYADTDSLHLLGDHWETYTDDKGKEALANPPADIVVHPTTRGAWKYEYSFTNAFYVRPKFYLEQLADGSYKVAAAGLPQQESEKLTFDDLTDGKVITGKLSPRSVPGGVVLEDVPYTIKL